MAIEDFKIDDNLLNKIQRAINAEILNEDDRIKFDEIIQYFRVKENFGRTFGGSQRIQFFKQNYGFLRGETTTESASKLWQMIDQGFVPKFSKKNNFITYSVSGYAGQDSLNNLVSKEGLAFDDTGFININKQFLPDTFAGQKITSLADNLKELERGVEIESAVFPNLYYNKSTKMFEETAEPILGNAGSGVTFSKGHLIYANNAGVSSLNARLLGFQSGDAAKDKANFEVASVDKVLKNPKLFTKDSIAVFEITGNIMGIGEKSFMIKAGYNELPIDASELSKKSADVEQVAKSFERRINYITDLFTSKKVKVRAAAEVNDTDYFFDVETTRYKDTDYITQLGIVKGSGKSESYSTTFQFVDKDGNIIKDAERSLDFPVKKSQIVAQAENIREIIHGKKAGDNVISNINDINRQFSGAKRLIGYNIESFDIPVLKNAGVNSLDNVEIVDVYKMLIASKGSIEKTYGISFGSGSSSLTLENVYNALRVKGIVKEVVGGAHSADVDIEMTREVYKAIAPIYEKTNTNVSNAIRLQGMLGVIKGFGGDTAGIKTLDDAKSALSKVISSRIDAGQGVIMSNLNIFKSMDMKGIGAVNLEGITGEFVDTDSGVMFRPSITSIGVKDIKSMSMSTKAQEFSEIFEQRLSKIISGKSGKTEDVSKRIQEIVNNAKSSNWSQSQIENLSNVLNQLAEKGDIDQKDLNDLMKTIFTTSISKNKSSSQLSSVLFESMFDIKKPKNVGEDVIESMRYITAGIVKNKFGSMPSLDLETKVREIIKTINLNEINKNAGNTLNDKLFEEVIKQGNFTLESEKSFIRKLLRSTVIYDEVIERNQKTYFESADSYFDLFKLVSEKMHRLNPDDPSYEVFSNINQLTGEAREITEKSIYERIRKSVANLSEDEMEQALEQEKQWYENVLYKKKENYSNELRQEFVESRARLLLLSEKHKRISSTKRAVDIEYANFDDYREETVPTVKGIVKMPSHYNIPNNDRIAQVLSIKMNAEAREFGIDFRINDAYKKFKIFYVGELALESTRQAGFMGLDPNKSANAFAETREVQDTAFEKAWRDYTYYRNISNDTIEKYNVHKLIQARDISERQASLEGINRSAGKITVDLASNESQREFILEHFYDPKQSYVSIRQPLDIKVNNYGRGGSSNLKRIKVTREREEAYDAYIRANAEKSSGGSSINSSIKQSEKIKMNYYKYSEGYKDTKGKYMPIRQSRTGWSSDKLKKGKDYYLKKEALSSTPVKGTPVYSELDPTIPKIEDVRETVIPKIVKSETKFKTRSVGYSSLDSEAAVEKAIKAGYNILDKLESEEIKIEDQLLGLEKGTSGYSKLSNDLATLRSIKSSVSRAIGIGIGSEEAKASYFKAVASGIIPKASKDEEFIESMFLRSWIAEGRDPGEFDINEVALKEILPDEITDSINADKAKQMAFIGKEYFGMDTITVDGKEYSYKDMLHQVESFSEGTVITVGTKKKKRKLTVIGQKYGMTLAKDQSGNIVSIGDVQDVHPERIFDDLNKFFEDSIPEHTKAGMASLEKIITNASRAGRQNYVENAIYASEMINNFLKTTNIQSEENLSAFLSLYKTAFEKAGNEVNVRVSQNLIENVSQISELISRHGDMTSNALGVLFAGSQPDFAPIVSKLVEGLDQEQARELGFLMELMFKSKKIQPKFISQMYNEISSLKDEGALTLDYINNVKRMILEANSKGSMSSIAKGYTEEEAFNMMLEGARYDLTNRESNIHYILSRALNQKVVAGEGSSLGGVDLSKEVNYQGLMNAIGDPVKTRLYRTYVGKSTGYSNEITYENLKTHLKEGTRLKQHMDAGDNLIDSLEKMYQQDLAILKNVKENAGEDVFVKLATIEGPEETRIAVLKTLDKISTNKMNDNMRENIISVANRAIREGGFLKGIIIKGSTIKNIEGLDPYSEEAARISMQVLGYGGIYDLKTASFSGDKEAVQILSELEKYVDTSGVNTQGAFVREMLEKANIEEEYKKYAFQYEKELLEKTEYSRLKPSDDTYIRAEKIFNLFAEDLEKSKLTAKQLGIEVSEVMDLYRSHVYGSINDVNFEALTSILNQKDLKINKNQFKAMVQSARYFDVKNPDVGDENQTLAKIFEKLNITKDVDKAKFVFGMVASSNVSERNFQSEAQKWISAARRGNLDEMLTEAEALGLNTDVLKELIEPTSKAKKANIFKTETADRVAKKINDVVDFKSLKGNMRGLLPIGIMFGTFALIGAQSRAEFKRQQIEAQNLQTVNVLSSNNLLAKQMRYAPTNAEMSATVAIANQPNMNDNANVLNMLGITNGRIEYRA